MRWRLRASRTDACEMNAAGLCNTGQILLGAGAGTNEFGTYCDSMLQAAGWFVHTQDKARLLAKKQRPCHRFGFRIWGLNGV